MDYLGLIVELLLLILGVRLYLFMAGHITVKDGPNKRKAEEFRASNGWLRYAALALSAIMLVNVYLHLQSLFTGG